jgi:DNA-binding NarL/FixJ family response regulator
MNHQDLGPTLGIIRVLVLDDHVMFAESLARLLRDEPDLTIVGTPGRLDAAVELAVATDPHVVLVDYQLPEVDLATAARALRAVAPGVKLLVVTAHDDDAALIAALEARCDGFVTKDRAAREVVDAIRAIHGGRSMLSLDLVSRDLPPLAAPASAPKADQLSRREGEVLAFLAEGRSAAEIAVLMQVSVNTVRNHLQRLFVKLGAHSKREAVAIGRERGLLSVP